MTVHGAKGLEAPIVFLPDTMQLPDRRTRCCGRERDGLPLWRPRARLRRRRSIAPNAQALRRRELQEYRRLLYVALTRAQDRLYVCGWQTQRRGRARRRAGTRCAAPGWPGSPTPFAFDTRAADRRARRLVGEGLRLVVGADRAAGPRRARAPTGSPSAPLPAWARPPAAGRARPAKAAAAVAPERRRAGDACRRWRCAAATASSAGSSSTGCCRACPNCRRRSARRRRGGFSRCRCTALAADEQDEIRRETLAVLDDARFRRAVGPGRAGRGAGRRADRRARACRAQIDRLVVDDGPRADRRLQDRAARRRRREDEVAAALSAAARDLPRGAGADLSRIAPIDCALLWTDGPRLMPISPEPRSHGHLP